MLVAIKLVVIRRRLLAARITIIAITSARGTVGLSQIKLISVPALEGGTPLVGSAPFAENG